MVKNINGFHTEPLAGRAFAIGVSKEHTFGTDAFLLAEFAAPRRQDVAVDLGTGCGIIPFLWLRDHKTAGVTGVEISGEAVALCRDTAARLDLTDRFAVWQADLKTVGGPTAFGPATLVTCNPPYTELGHGALNRTPQTAAARHGVCCTFGDVAACAARLLKTGGRFCLCQRPEHLPRVIETLAANRLEPKRLRLVAKKPGCAPWLFLLEARKDGNPGLRVAPTLYVYKEDGTWSGEMQRLYES